MAEKRILVQNYGGYMVADLSIGQAMREAGVTVEELDRTFVEYARGGDGGYKIHLVVRDEDGGGG